MEKSRCKGKQDVANRNLSADDDQRLFSLPVQISEGRPMKKSAKADVDESCPSLRRPSFFRGTSVNIGGGGYLLSAVTVQLSKRSKCRPLYVCATFLCFVLSTFLWTER